MNQKLKGFFVLPEFKNPVTHKHRTANPRTEVNDLLSRRDDTVWSLKVGYKISKETWNIKMKIEQNK